MDSSEKTQTNIKPEKSVKKQDKTFRTQKQNDNTQQKAGDNQEQADNLQEKSQDSRANATDDPGKTESDQDGSRSDEPGIPQKIESKFDYCKRCLSASSVVLYIWDIVLTEEDRARLGNDLENAYEANRGIVGIWMRLCNYSY